MCAKWQFMKGVEKFINIPSKLIVNTYTYVAAYRLPYRVDVLIWIECKHPNKTKQVYINSLTEKILKSSSVHKTNEWQTKANFNSQTWYIRAFESKQNAKKNLDDSINVANYDCCQDKVYYKFTKFSGNGGRFIHKTIAYYYETINWINGTFSPLVLKRANTRKKLLLRCHIFYPPNMIVLHCYDRCTKLLFRFMKDRWVSSHRYQIAYYNTS